VNNTNVAKQLIRIARAILAQDEGERVLGDDWLPEEKRGEWNLQVNKHSRTRYGWFLRNPSGGGTGMASYPSIKSAIAAATRRNKDWAGKDKIWVIISVWDFNKGEYVTKKKYWMDVPK